MPEILSIDQWKIRPLFRELERSHALVAAFFENCASARLFVDDVVTTRTGLLLCNSRLLCAGDAAQSDFLDEMQRMFADQLIPSHIARGNDTYLAYASGDGWDTTLQGIFPKSTLYHGTRQYYEITDFVPRDDLQLPPGFSLQPVTPEFMSSGAGGLSALEDEMCSERASVDEFLQRSFGVCPVYQNEIAGWCLSEYNVGARCEIGIATAPDHQRKGVATLAAWSFLAEAYRRGYTRVGWDCWVQNVPSSTTARKAGFTLMEEYPAVVIEF